MPPGAPLEFAPENEQGVVYLFSHWAGENAYKIEDIRPWFPDCIAVKNGRHVRIEFEYRSSGFKSHLNRARTKNCDILVCWIHNWPAVPSWLDVIELRQEYGMGFNVWVHPINEPYASEQRKLKRTRWSVPRNARPGDLVLDYKTAPNQFLDDAWKVTTDVAPGRASYKPGTGYFADIRRVCRFNAPIHLSQLQEHPVLRTSGFVRGNIRGAYKITSDWPQVYRVLTDRNPSCRNDLDPYGPGRLWAKAL
jgi:hypothetical protein